MRRARSAAALGALSLLALPAGWAAADTGFSNVFTIDLRAGCARPAVPAFRGLPAGVVAGNPLILAWTPTLAGDAGGLYQLDVTTAADCVSSRRRFVTAVPSFALPTLTGESGTYCAVVRAVSGSGCAGDDSAPASVAVTPAPAAFLVVRPQPPAEAVAVVGQAPPAGTLRIRNLGGSASSLALTSGQGFVAASPASFPEVAPGQEVAVELRFDPASTQARGLQLGSLRATWNDGGEKSVAAAVVLTTLDAPPTQDAAGSRLRFTDNSEVHFVAPADQSPPQQQITLRNTGAQPLRVVPTVGPGGAWLSVSGDFVTAVEPQADRVYTLSADRSRRTTAEGAPPLLTHLTFNNADGTDADRAVLRVFDEEAAPPVSGRNRPPLAEGEASLVLSSTAHVQGAGALFVSDGWIRNQGPAPAIADLYYTPDGQDGLLGEVKKATVSLQGYGTYRLADFLLGLFQATGSGHVEVRSGSLASLAARTTVDSLSRRDGVVARFGAEIPTVRSSQGARASLATGPLVLPGIRGGQGSRYRTNLILSETSGAAVEARARLVGADGATLAEVTRAVAPWAKLQIGAGDASLFPANLGFEGASLEVEAVGGAGTLAAFATVIDNDSQAYTTRAGRFVAERFGGPPPTRWVVPAAAHIAGAGGAFFRTNLFVKNGASRLVSVRVTFRKDPNTSFADPPSSSVFVTIPARGSRTFEDALVSLFGLPDGAGTAGMLLVEGSDLGAVVIASETATPIAGPSDLSRGISPNTLGAYAPESVEALGDPALGAPSLVVSHPALEESTRFRTNLILAEVGGAPVEVRVRLVAPGGRGATLAQQTFSLSAFERRQIGRVISALAGAGPDHVDVETSVEWVSGAGRVLAVATKIDNDPDSKRSDIYVLGPSGLRQGSIGY